MKGEIFVGLIDLVETQFGEEVADELFEQVSLPSGGAYTRVGTYDHAEIVDLVVALSEMTSIDPAKLQQVFGSYLFSRLVDWHQDFVAGYTNSFDLMMDIGNVIHVNVRKLYPEAQLPEITTETPSPGQLILRYRSDRGLAHVCHGLIQGCVAWFKEDIKIKRQDKSTGPLDQSAIFLLTTRVPSHD